MTAEAQIGEDLEDSRQLSSECVSTRVCRANGWAERGYVAKSTNERHPTMCKWYQLYLRFLEVSNSGSTSITSRYDQRR